MTLLANVDSPVFFSFAAHSVAPPCCRVVLAGSHKPWCTSAETTLRDSIMFGAHSVQSVTSTPSEQLIKLPRN